MMRRIRGLAIAVVAAVLATGCNDSNPTSPPPTGPPPDLSGTYDLTSLTQAGVTLTPPAATGTFMITQTSSSATEATGDLTVDITIPGNQIMGSGTYTIRSNGSWEQSLPGQQAVGTYAVVGSTLTVIVTQPAQAASTSVWQKR